MPSLRALEEFKSSLQLLGNEFQTMRDLELPLDELPLPDHEPAVAATDSPAPLGADDSGGSAAPDSGPFEAEEDRAETDIFGDLSDLLGGADSTIPDISEPPGDWDAAPEDSGFGNFIDSIPDDFAEAEDTGSPAPLSSEDDFPPLDDFSQAEDGFPVNDAESGVEIPGDPQDDFGLPPGLLDGLSDEIEAEQDSGGSLEFPGGEEALADSDGFDLGDFPDFGMEEPGGDAASDGDGFDLGDLPDFGVEETAGGETPADSGGIDLDELPDFGMGEPGGEEVLADDDGFDLGDLSDFGSEEPGGDAASDDALDLSALPDFGSDDTAGFDLGESPGLPDEADFAETAGNAGSDGDFDLGDLPDFGVEEPAGGEAPADSGSLDLDGLPDFGSDDSLALPGEEASFDAADETPPDSGADAFTETGTGDFADTGSGGGFDLGDLPDFGVEEPGEDASNDDALDLSALPDFGSDDTAGFDSGESLELPGEEASLFTQASGEAADISADDDNFDFGGEAGEFDAEAAVLEEIPGDSFDSFNPESGVGEFNAPDDEFGNLDDFSLPEMGAGFGEPSPPAGASKAARGTDGIPDADDVEEINLTTEELERLLTTLSSYPLNLRVACEELIAEQAVAPDQMSRLVRSLIDGAPAKETASLAGKILDKTIPIPKGFEKKTGKELEAEQASFAYIFVHNFLPVLRLFLMISLALLSAGYLVWRYIYTPIRAERIYELGIERIDAGEYSRANERFVEAFGIHQKKDWFYTYARAFRDARQYTLAEEKYGELLYYTASKNKRYIPEKAAVLEYADLETNYIGNYEMADTIIRRNILDYSPLDREALLALGDNSLAWGEYDPARLEDAREAYARIMEQYGRSDPLLERMLKYFIRTDNLAEVLSLQSYFMASPKREISASSLAEMGGYFLDKRLEEVRGVPNEYLEQIGGIREILLRAAQQDSMLPEPYYHLARYYNYFENAEDERLTLELAVRVFEAAGEESPKRIGYHINALRRYAEILADRREFFPAEETLVKGANLYEDALSRRLLKPSPEFGRVYAGLGDLEYFVKDGDMRSALDYYLLGEQSGWAPPEVQYRMGGAHYQLREWGPALDRFFEALRETPFNRRVLYALGNVSYMRGNYFAAQGYYDRLLEMLDEDRARLPPIASTDDETQLDLAERLMVAQNNMGVTLEALTERTGNSAYRSRAQGLYSDSERAWDVLTRNPNTMIRMHPSPDINAPGVNPAYLNVQNSLHPVPGYEPQFFLRIDKDMLEPSAWEDLAPPGYRLSEGIHAGY